jgi:hypothetical protein
MIKTACFGQYWPSSGFSSERIVCRKSVYIKHAAVYRRRDLIIEDLELNVSYSLGVEQMKNLMMANVGRNMQFLSSSNKDQLDTHCCVINCGYPTY